MKEGKTVLHTKAVIDGVEQEVLIMPITRVDCIEDTADVLNSAAAGDCIPIIDVSDSGQMKKISVENLLPSGSQLAGNHDHDDRYYTETEIDGKLSGKANSSHTHTASQVTGLPTSLPANGGDADTAVKLKTARNINGVAFDGSKDITVTAAANGGNADTVGGAAVMTTAALGLHRMASGTAAPTSATCPAGCWYGQYE